MDDRRREPDASGKGETGKAKSRNDGQYIYDQLDSNIIPIPQGEEDEGIDSGQVDASTGAVAIPHRPSISGSEEELKGAVATGGRKKPRNLKKHAFQKKVLRRGKQRTSSSSGESQVVSPKRVAVDPQNILEDESYLEDPAEMEERLMEELEEKVTGELRKAEKANWMEAAEAKWKDETKGELQKLREDLISRLEEQQAAKVQAQRELENTKQKNAAILRLKAKELQDKEASIKSLQEEVEKLKHCHKAELDTRGPKHESEVKSLQYELGELKQERERGRARVEDKLRAMEEPALTAGVVPGTTIAQRMKLVICVSYCCLSIRVFFCCCCFVLCRNKLTLHKHQW